MIKRLAIAGMLLATPAAAEVWATGDCMTSNGKNIRYALHDGKGMIAYDDEGPYEIFSKRDGEMGVITHIGNRGNMVMAVDLNTGRGYIITQFDNGNTVEKNVSCRLGSTNR
jgi:hypothetical protein